MLNKKKLKILYTIPNFDTAGSGIPLFKIASQLDGNAFEPEIACLHDRGDLFQKVKSSGIKIHLIELYKNARPLSKMIYKCYQLSNIFKKINPDIIHSYHYAADYTEPIAARMAGIKWIYTKKNMSWHGPSYRGWRLRSLLAHGILCQNTDMMEQFFPGWGKVQLIPIGVDFEEFKLCPSNNGLRAKWGIPKKSRLIITVANLIPIKGIEVLINAFAKLHEEYLDWYLLIVGNDSTDYAQELKNMVSDNEHLKKKIIFTGKQKNIREYLDIAEIFVLPTLAKGEGAPISLLEAMANEKNILASSVPGIKDQMRNFPQHTFPAQDEHELGKKLEYFMKKDECENKRLGRLFSHYVKKHHDISIEKELIQSYYKNILSI